MGFGEQFRSLGSSSTIKLLRVNRPYLAQCKALTSACNRLHHHREHDRVVDAEQVRLLKEVFKSISLVLQKCAEPESETDADEIAKLMKQAANEVVRYRSRYPSRFQLEPAEQNVVEEVNELARMKDSEATARLRELQDDLKKREASRPLFSGKMTIRIISYKEPIVIGTGAIKKCLIESNADLNTLLFRLCMTQIQEERENSPSRTSATAIAFHLNPHFYDRFPTLVYDFKPNGPIHPRSFSTKICSLGDKTLTVLPDRCRSPLTIGSQPSLVAFSAPTANGVITFHNFWKLDPRNLALKGSLGILTLFHLGFQNPEPWDKFSQPLISSKLPSNLQNIKFFIGRERWEFKYEPEPIGPDISAMSSSATLVPGPLTQGPGPRPRELIGTGGQRATPGKNSGNETGKKEGTQEPTTRKGELEVVGKKGFLDRASTWIGLKPKKETLSTPPRPEESDPQNHTHLAGSPIVMFTANTRTTNKKSLWKRSG